MQKNLLILVSLVLFSSLFAKGDSQKVGDALAIMIPLSAYGTTLYLNDNKGNTQFYKSYSATLLTTYALKYSVREQRSDSHEKDSFPSGYTSSVFSGATFMHKRYGIKYAIVPYLGAIYTAYSRVQSHRHYTRDVVAGAIVGMASSWYFTSPYKNIDITPIVDADYKALQVSYKW